jgi:radical SAM superfamily enzyme YgiQ (UPF0313 family)
VGFGVYVWNDAQVQDVIRCLRSRGYTGPILLGGPQITWANEPLGDLYPQADWFIRGFAEQAIIDWCRRFDTNEAMPQGVYRAGEQPPYLAAQASLESVPSPYLNGEIPLGAQKFVRWETSRGCRYKCTFCQHRGDQQKVRPVVQAERLLREIELFCATGVESIAVLDPVFTDSPHAMTVLRSFRERGYRGRLSLQCRPETMTEEILDAMHGLNVCLEFGIQTTNRLESEIVERPNNLRQIEITLQRVQERGIDHEINLIFGLPAQTLDTFRESVRWCIDRRVKTIRAFPLMMLRGTALAQNRGHWNFTESSDPIPHVISSSSFSRSDWQKMRGIADALDKSTGTHPPTLEDLDELVDSIFDSGSQWSPAPLNSWAAANESRPTAKSSTTLLTPDALLQCA